MSEANHQVLDVDVLFVGAGSASLAGALHLKKLSVNEVQDISIAIIEKAREIGAHSLSGAIIDPRSLNEIIPNHLEKAGLQIYYLFPRLGNGHHDLLFQPARFEYPNTVLIHSFPAMDYLQKISYRDNCPR